MEELKKEELKMEEEFIEATKNSNYRDIDNLCIQYKEKDLKNILIYCFILICTKTGNQDFAKHIIYKGGESVLCYIFDKEENIFKYFKMAIDNNNLDIANWLNFNIKNNEDLKCAYRSLFFNSCTKKNNLKTVQFLYYNNNIDIHYDDDYAFRCAVMNNNLDIARWLFSIGGVNVHCENDQAFKWSCSMNDLEMAKWLVTVCDDYYVEIEDEKIKLYKISDKIVAYCIVGQKRVRLRNYNE
jgi:hypothetical protein